MKPVISFMVFVFLVWSMIGCSTAPQVEVTSTTTQTEMGAYSGPKARIAVSRFSDKTGKGWWTGAIGDGMSDMLSTALFNTSRFVVLERSTLKDLLAEQDLAMEGRIEQESAAQPGKIKGAELLVVGAVTEFEPDTSGLGLGIGGGAGNLAGNLLGTKKKSYVAIDVRVIDTSTSEILVATSVKGTASDYNLGGMLVGSKVGGNLGTYSRTPIEKAIRVCLSEAVNVIINKTPPRYFSH